MSKALKLDLLKQQRDIAKEIFYHLSQIKKLNGDNRKQLGLNPAEIFAKSELYKKDIAVLVLKKEQLEYWIDLLNNCIGKTYHPAIHHEYPLFVTKIIHYN